LDELMREMRDDQRTPEASDEAALENADGVDAPEVEAESLVAELERARAAHARAVADYQNLQRRSREERAETTRLLTKTLVLNYLPVLDDLNRALDAVSEHEEIVDHPWVEGVRMVQRKFSGILEAAAVSQIEAGPGTPFNPQLHEAVAHQSGPLNEVIGVVQNGYTIDGTIVRPAMVVVGNGEAPAGRSE
jgi:molecular chaperone GrpE